MQPWWMLENTQCIIHHAELWDYAVIGSGWHATRHSLTERAGSRFAGSTPDTERSGQNLGEGAKVRRCEGAKCKGARVQRVDSQ